MYFYNFYTKLWNEGAIKVVSLYLLLFCNIFGLYLDGLYSYLVMKEDKIYERFRKLSGKQKSR